MSQWRTDYNMLVVATYRCEVCNDYKAADWINDQKQSGLELGIAPTSSKLPS